MARKRNARVSVTADPKGLERGLRRSETALGKFEKAGGRAMHLVGRAGARVGRLLGGLRSGIGLGGLGLAAFAGNEARKMVGFEDTLTRLAITSRGALGPLDKFRSRVFAISNATGVAKEDVLAAAYQFVALTGDAKTAAQSMELFARISKASGAEMNDIASSAAALQQNLNIKPEQFEQAFSILIRAGKVGSVELRDMASIMAQLAPQMAQFAGGSGVQGMKDLAAALQLGNQGFNDANMAATAFQGLMTSIVKHADRLKKGGVNVFFTGKDGVKHLRSFRDIINDISHSKLARDPTLLSKALGRDEGRRIYMQLVKVPGALDRVIAETGRAKDVSEDYNTYQQSAAAKLARTWNEIKNQVASTFTPEKIKAFAEALKDAAAVLGGILSDFKAIAEFMGGGPATGPHTRDAEQSRKARNKFADKTDEQLRNMYETTGIGGYATLIPDPLAQREIKRRKQQREAARQRDKAIEQRVDAAHAASIIGRPGAGAAWAGVSSRMPPATEVKVRIQPAGMFSAVVEQARRVGL